MLFPESYCYYEVASLTNEEVIYPLSIRNMWGKQCLPYGKKKKKTGEELSASASGISWQKRQSLNWL